MKPINNNSYSPEQIENNKFNNNFRKTVKKRSGFLFKEEEKERRNSK
jgi:hypothetical protein